MGKEKWRNPVERIHILPSPCHINEGIQSTWEKIEEKFSLDT